MRRQLAGFAVVALSVFVAVSIGARVQWHEDPQNNFVKNVYFTDNLNNWIGENAALSIAACQDRPCLKVVSNVDSTGGTPGVVQLINVTPGQRYRLKASGFHSSNANVYLWVGTKDTRQNIYWNKDDSLPKDVEGQRIADFTVPDKITSVYVGALFDGTQNKGDTLTMGWISVMIFTPNWVSNGDFSQGTNNWVALNGVLVTKNTGADGGISVSTVVGSDAKQRNGVIQTGIGVESNKRYRLRYTGARFSNAFVWPRISNTANDAQQLESPTVATDKAASLPLSTVSTTPIEWEFTVPETVSRITVGFVFATGTDVGTYIKGDRFIITSVDLQVLPNLLPDGDLDHGIGPWKINGQATVQVTVDGGDNSLTATTTGAVGTPGLRLDKIPVIPGTKYHFSITGRIHSNGNAYPWVQEPNGEDLYWVFKDSLTNGAQAEPRGVTFIAPRNDQWVNIGVLFSKHPNDFAVGDTIVLHSARLTGGPLSYGRPPADPVRPLPPPPPPPKVITLPPNAPPEPPPPWLAILNKPVNKTSLNDKVLVAKSNTHPLHPECEDGKLDFIKKYDYGEFAKCSQDCEVTFYNKGSAGNETSYNYYRTCFDCCAHRQQETDGIEADGTNGKTWIPVTADMIESQAAKGVTAVYTADQNGKLTVTATSADTGCNAGNGASLVTFIKGPWTKIIYRETFRGNAKCAGVFGDNSNHFSGVQVTNGLLPFSRAGGDLLYDLTHMKNFSEDMLRSTSGCPAVPWWDERIGGVQAATVALRRDPAATRAGFSTGVFCGAASWEYTDIFIWE